MIRLIDTRTGQAVAASEVQRLAEARAAGALHYVQCDHEGYPLKNAQGMYEAVTDPGRLSIEAQREVLEDVRKSPQRSYFNTAEQTAESVAANRAAMIERFGSQSVAPSHAGPRVGDIVETPHDSLPSYEGVTITRVKHPMAAS
ncbi:hypothetical protein AB4Y42_06085 [Paraburkholderia sp. EG286B]|uniref:hypothetical protein n=1 Tax=Paraburkholderia sp. EG286B TaxID=3237011 RepID=UPI0034D39124